jgi:hypothetical protein
MPTKAEEIVAMAGKLLLLPALVLVFSISTEIMARVAVRGRAGGAVVAGTSRCRRCQSACSGPRSRSKDCRRSSMGPAAVFRYGRRRRDPGHAHCDDNGTSLALTRTVLGSDQRRPHAGQLGSTPIGLEVAEMMEDFSSAAEERETPDRPRDASA